MRVGRAAADDELSRADPFDARSLSSLGSNPGRLGFEPGRPPD